jgi:Ca2+-binding RTX toxin-like protein
MDFNDVEQLDINALGRADTITINDLTGTDLSQIVLNLANTNGGGDGAIDTVVVNVTSRDDVISVLSANNTISVFGLTSMVMIVNAESNNDRLTINALASDDTVSASRLLAVVSLTIDGGVGDDVLVGGLGNNVLIGGLGDDGSQASEIVWIITANANNQMDKLGNVITIGS